MELTTGEKQFLVILRSIKKSPKDYVTGEDKAANLENIKKRGMIYFSEKISPMTFEDKTIQNLLEKKLSELEKLAKDAGFSFVELSGDIGILANGAGLTMAIIDVLSQFGLESANFLDVGGGASKERVYKALDLLFKLNLKGVLINIFGGITRCDDVARAIIEALENINDVPPIVIRLAGTNKSEGLALLKEYGIDAYQDANDAIERLKELFGA